MSPAQKRLRELLDKQSHDRQRAIELSREDSLTDETRSELDEIETRAADYERQIRAARLAVDDEDAQATVDKADLPPDPEQRERIELRSRAAVGRYLSAALRGRLPDGAERELGEAAGLEAGQIPFELWQRPPAPEHRDGEHRAITPAPGTTGINLDVLRPYVFAPSVVSRLMVEMPQVPSGSWASGTISTAAGASAAPKSDGTTGDVPETAAAFTVTTTTPHRIGASMNLTLEDIATVGQANFESLLREHVSMRISSELDDQMLNGDGTGDNISGMFARLTDPAAAPTAATDFDGFAAAFAGGIDGLWANSIREISIVCGPATMELSATSFQTAASYKGEKSAAAYAMEYTGGWWTNKRMPAAGTFESVDNVQQAILCRKGRSMMPSPMRTAVCPHWGYFQIDDVYTGARRGTRRFVINTLIGDLILVQPDAYEQIAFRVA